MDFKTIQAVEISGGVGILTLNRPDRRNAISIEMRLEILECMRKWKESQTGRRDDHHGLGRCLQCGVRSDGIQPPRAFQRDLRDVIEVSPRALEFPETDDSRRQRRRAGRRVRPGEALRHPHRFAKGRLRPPRDQVRHPSLVTPLRWIIGEGLARHLCLTGRRVDAVEACRIGLVSEVVE